MIAASKMIEFCNFVFIYRGDFLAKFCFKVMV